MDNLLLLAAIAGAVTEVIVFAGLLCKPVRNKVLGLNDVREGQLCLLRSEILRTYYHHREQKKIRQYEYENMVFVYKAYKALGGNSFVDHIHAEIEEWEVVS